MPFDNFHHYPYASRNLPVSIETPPLEYCPVTKIKYYEISNTWFASNVSSWNAVLERIEISVTIDYGDYEAALLAAGISGNYDTNIQSITVCISDAAPVGLPVCVEQVLDIIGNPAAGEIVWRATFRPDEDWAGQIKYVSFVLHFLHNGQDDYIVVPFAIVTAVQGQRYNTDEPFSLLEWRKNGQVITNLCTGGPYGEIELWAEHNLADWDVMVIMERNGQVIAEYDAFPSTNFPTLTDSPILNVQSVAIMGGQREVVTVDEAQLQGDECFFVIIKNNAPDPVLDVCEEVFDVEVDIHVSLNVDIDFTIAPVLSDFSKIIFTLTRSLEGYSPPCSFTAESALQVDVISVVNPCYGFEYMNNSNVIYTLTCEVQTIHGCFYTQTLYFTGENQDNSLTFSFT